MCSKFIVVHCFEFYVFLTVICIHTPIPQSFEKKYIYPAQKKNQNKLNFHTLIHERKYNPHISKFKYFPIFKGAKAPCSKSKKAKYSNSAAFVSQV